MLKIGGYITGDLMYSAGKLVVNLTVNIRPSSKFHSCKALPNVLDTRKQKNVEI